MAVSVIATKVWVSLRRKDLVPRANLVERLESGLSCPLPLVSAPAGYGKTTLLAELATGVPVAWFSLNKKHPVVMQCWFYEQVRANGTW